MMRITLSAVAVALVAACTPTEVAMWQDWHAQDPVAAEAFARQLTTETTSDLTNTQGSRWDRIAWCESGGRWDYPLVTNRTGTYSGGLMIWTKAWAAYGGHEFAPHAYLASRGEQIEIAERILADRGWQAWDCA